MNNPLVSVIIPVYNVENYIARCLDSVISQTYNNLEIIVVNDATPDNSMTIAYEYAKKDKRFKIIENKSNRGLMSTRRKGYQAATGKYLTFADSDDSLPANAIELLLNKALTSDADIVAGTIRHTDRFGKSKDWPSSLPNGENAFGVYKSLLYHTFTHNLCGKLFKRDLFSCQNYQSFENMNYGEDVCLFYQLVANITSATCIENVIYYYQGTKGLSSVGEYNQQRIENLIMASKVRLESCSIYPELIPSAERFVTNIIYGFRYSGYNVPSIESILKKLGMEKYIGHIQALKVLSIRNLLSHYKHIILYWTKHGERISRT